MLVNCNQYQVTPKSIRCKLRVPLFFIACTRCIALTHSLPGISVVSLTHFTLPYVQIKLECTPSTSIRNDVADWVGLLSHLSFTYPGWGTCLTCWLILYIAGCVVATVISLLISGCVAATLIAYLVLLGCVAATLIALPIILGCVAATLVACTWQGVLLLPPIYARVYPTTCSPIYCQRLCCCLLCIIKQLNC